MLSLHRAMGTWLKLVDIYIALTEFGRRKFIEGGLPADKIVVKGNFIHPAPAYPGPGSGEYALYVGRLDAIKGVRTLLSAWERLNTDIPLKIVGDGPLALYVDEVTQCRRNIEVMSWVPRARVFELLGEARALIFPSTCYEGQSLALLEAFSMGTPIIASSLGSITEMIDPGRTGLLFRAGDPDDLAARVEWAWSHPDEMRSMREQVRKEFEERYTGTANYARLMEIYDTAVRRASSPPAVA